MKRKNIRYSVVMWCVDCNKYYKFPWNVLEDIEYAHKINFPCKCTKLIFDDKQKKIMYNIYREKLSYTTHHSFGGTYSSKFQKKFQKKFKIDLSKRLKGHLNNV